MKIFTPIKALNKQSFAISSNAIKAILTSPDDFNNSVLVLEPEYVYDIADGEFYLRIEVKGSVNNLTNYINEKN